MPAATDFSLRDDGLSQNCCGGGAVAGFVIGAAGDFFDHLRAHVFELVFQLDFFGNGNTVFGDARCAEGFSIRLRASVSNLTSLAAMLFAPLEK